jgi:hypothetical protein
MCTLTWRAVEDGGYDLFFNRDERHSRAPELEPRGQKTSTGVAYVAPADGDHGGTWITLNEHGLTVCLLNDYPRGVAEAGRMSRGALPLICAACARAADAAAVLKSLGNLADYAPFHLVAIDAGARGVHLRWDGRRLETQEAPGFLTSSSFEPARVQARRAADYGLLVNPDSDALRAFHHRHDSSAGAESVCMRRADACTRSVCEVRVRTESRTLVYEAMNRDGAATNLPVVLTV